jgi:hypothetical protein
MSRNYLKGRDGDRINAVLAAAGYNFGLLLRWLASLLRALVRMSLLFTARRGSGDQYWFPMSIKVANGIFCFFALFCLLVDNGHFVCRIRI